MGVVEIITEAGVARAELDGDGATARFMLALTHGAGGSVEAPDVLAVRDAALRLGGMVARVTQPYRVSGARARLRRPAGRRLGRDRDRAA